MTADNDNLVAVPTAIFQEVKAWIAHQEAYEAQNNKPALLTKAQRKALEILRLPSPTPAPPELGNDNYVGALMEFRAKRLGGTLSWEEGGAATCWTCTVTISEALESLQDQVAAFPAERYGLDPVSRAAPVFPTKKAAKQFAAKCALDWLADKGFQHAAPSIVTQAIHSPTASTPLPTPTISSQKRSVEDLNNFAIPPPPKRKESVYPLVPCPRPGATTPEHQSLLPITMLVSKLCDELGIPAPKYVFEEDPLDTNAWNARPEFEDYGDKDLRKLMADGVVRGVAGGKDKARRAVAQKLLISLQEIDAERSDEIAQLLK